jgi:exoribonuclease R
VRIARPAGDELAAGLDAIREQLGVPRGFPAEVLAAADEAVERRPGAGHVDRTDVAYVTLDPATATDLDQAFAIETAGSDIILRYAIADVGFFVDPQSVLETAAWERGTTTYLPDEKAPLYPPALSERAGSLLPDGPRPAVVFIVRVDERGDVVLDGAERAVIHSRAKLAYDAVDDDDLPAGFAELSRRIVAAEERRGAPRVEFPEQRLERTEHGWRLAFDTRLQREDENAGMSLATNLAVAAALHAAGTGLFRVMPEVTERAVRRLRHSAAAFGLKWPADVPLARFQRSLRSGDPRAAAFLLAVRRATGGATYEPYRDGTTPWHSAMAATYCHATAPLRRLADRYVVEAALAVANGDPVPAHVAAAFEKLPAVMERAEQRAGQVDSAVDNLAEAVVLSGREGELFEGVIVDEDDRGPVLQIAEPAVLARVRAARVDPGSPVRVRLVAVDVRARTVEFERVG